MSQTPGMGVLMCAAIGLLDVLGVVSAQYEPAARPSTNSVPEGYGPRMVVSRTWLITLDQSCWGFAVASEVGVSSSRSPLQLLVCALSNVTRTRARSARRSGGFTPSCRAGGG